MKILLASQSPRRKELLEKMGLSFDVVSIHCNEDYPTTLPVYKIAGFLSEKKACAYQHLQKDEILITADTIVCLDNQVLGKPKNKDEARSMLKKLSNNTHIVYTGITLKTLQKTITKIDKAEVSFNKINDEEIDFYIENFKPMDKAGSYGIQDWLGLAKIKRILGSYYTIMGLPTHLVYESLAELNNAF